MLATSPWLHTELLRVGLPAICLEMQHVRAAMSAQRNKTDAADAFGIAPIMRTGWFRQAHIKTEACYRRLFEIERAINGLSAEERRAVRQERSAPLVADFEAWMQEHRAQLSPGHDLTKAMNYMLKRWASFTRFLEDGRICLSNNAAERALRGAALGRKSWAVLRFGSRRPPCRRPVQLHCLGEDGRCRSSGLAHRRPSADCRTSREQDRRAAALELEIVERCHRSLTMAAITHVFTISRVAQMLSEDEDWLFDVANEMEPEDGCLWIYGVGDEQTLAFTEFGIETLRELVQIHKADPSILRRHRGEE